jgi:hypothetical protein
VAAAVKPAVNSNGLASKAGVGAGATPTAGSSGVVVGTRASAIPRFSRPAGTPTGSSGGGSSGGRGDKDSTPPQPYATAVAVSGTRKAPQAAPAPTLPSRSLRGGAAPVTSIQGSGSSPATASSIPSPGVSPTAAGVLAARQSGHGAHTSLPLRRALLGAAGGGGGGSGGPGSSSGAGAPTLVAAPPRHLRLSGGGSGAHPVLSKSVSDAGASQAYRRLSGPKGTAGGAGAVGAAIRVPVGTTTQASAAVSGGVGKPGVGSGGRGVSSGASTPQDVGSADSGPPSDDDSDDVELDEDGIYVGRRSAGGFMECASVALHSVS